MKLCVIAKSLLSRPTLCDPTGCSPPGSSVRGILQARILEWVAISSSRGSSQPRDRTHISCVCCIGRWVLIHQCHLGGPSGPALEYKLFNSLMTLTVLVRGLINLQVRNVNILLAFPATLLLSIFHHTAAFV